ncbi:LysR family transcriptional regulator [Pigmentiphaga sp.]|uniref:LysR family transcriptional regulator n=1 Tax=Pigmentiphaga sp. TaxID=1977564 RepID=UPI0025ECC7CC|nr:LysR family transcriptional regulator [Pigmentiphaga sp.]
MKKQSSFDLNLLAYLEALIEESHVSRAAQRVNLSQPAMSLALKRLRTMFNDPILVQTAQGMRPTLRAQRLLGQVQDVLHQTERLVAPQQEFDCARTTQTFVLMASNFVASLFLAPLAAHFAEAAPHALLSIQQAPPYRVKEWFENSAVDLGASYAQDSLPGSLHRRTVFEDRLVCIARRGHPAFQNPIDLETFCAIPSVKVDKPHALRMTQTVERVLATTGHGMRVGTLVSEFLLVPEVVASSNMIAIAPESLLRRYAGADMLQYSPLPFDMPPLQLSLVWHPHTHNEPSHQWLRTFVRKAIIGGRACPGEYDTHPPEPAIVIH